MIASATRKIGGKISEKSLDKGEMLWLNGDNTYRKEIAMAVKTVSAKEVRAFIKENPELIKDETLWVNINGRGRLHTEVVKAFNRAKRSKVKYEVGTFDNRRTVLVGERGRKFVVLNTELREFAGLVGKRGRISAAVKAEFVKTLA